MGRYNANEDLDQLLDLPSNFACQGIIGALHQKATRMVQQVYFPEDVIKKKKFFTREGIEKIKMDSI